LTPFWAARTCSKKMFSGGKKTKGNLATTKKKGGVETNSSTKKGGKINGSRERRVAKPVRRCSQDNQWGAKEGGKN